MDLLDISVLHVEDNKAFRGLFKYLIKPEVRDYYCAQNGKEGLELFMKFKPEVVVTDISMPEMDGLELSRRIKSINPDTQIIVFSSVERETYLLEAINLGIEQFVIKDEDNFKEILYAIKKAAKDIDLKRKSLEQENRILMLSNAIEQSGSMVIITDPEGYIEFANKTYLKITGFEEKEVVGRHIVEFKDENYRKLFEEAAKFGSVFGEYMQVRKNKSPFWASCRISIIKNSAGIVTNLVESAEDISSKKEAEKAIEKANSARRNFLANMSHELRTPLNGVLGVTSILLETDTTIEQREYLNLQRSSAEALLKILNDILDFSQLEDNKIELMNKPFDLNQAINLTLDFFKISANEKNISIAYYPENNIYNYLIGDERRLQQIITNLIGNSLKFTEKGKVEVFVNKELETEDEIELIFTIKDTGVGIPKDKVDFIFERFTQVDGSFTRKYGGTGLGLAIVRDLIKLMDGKYWVESKEGFGSSFFIQIRFKKVLDGIVIENMRKREKKLISPSFSSNIIKILLVEDNLMNQKIVSGALRKYGHDITTAINGIDAIEKYKTGKYDLILMDIEMPIMNGIDAAKGIREHEKSNNTHTYIVALTAHIGKEIQKKCFEAGMDDFLIKPVNFELLFDIIEKLKSKNKNIDPATGKRKIDLISPKELSTNSYLKILFNFAINELPILIDELRKNIKEYQIDRAGLVLIRIKNLSNLIGAVGIKKALEKIETNIKSSDIDELNKSINLLVVDTLNLVNYISVQNSKLLE